MELDVTAAFPTLIGRLRVPDARSMNQDLQVLILAEEAASAEPGNIDGWHSQPDFFSRSEPAVATLITCVTCGVSRMIDASAGPGGFKGTLAISAWATICRTGAYRAPHSHPDSAWSGVYYVNAGTDEGHLLSGVLEFLDPRPGVETASAPGDPYGEPFRIRPQSGLLVIFASWLFHWVHPYSGSTPRIAVSFTATLGAPRPQPLDQK